MGETPYGVGYTVAGDHYLIYWYYPGVNQTTVQIGGSTPDGYLFVSPDPPAARAGMNVLLPPAATAIESVEWFIWGTNPTADWVGSPTSPFEFALYAPRPADTQAEPTWRSGDVAASDVSAGGEWVRFPVRIGLADLDRSTLEMFVEFRWLSETPASPLPGITSNLGSGTTWYAIPDGGVLDWQGAYYTDLMVRVNCAHTDVGLPISSPAALPDSFQLNFWETPDAEGLPIKIVKTTDSLHLWISSNEASGRYLTLSAWTDNVLSPKSEAIRLDVITSVSDEDDVLPTKPALSAYPNPFNSETTIISPSSGKIQLFDLLGRKVRELESSGSVGAGEFFYHWDGCDANGRPVASGVYFVRRFGASRVLKLILLK